MALGLLSANYPDVQSAVKEFAPSSFAMAIAVATGTIAGFSSFARYPVDILTYPGFPQGATMEFIKGSSPASALVYPPAVNV